MKNQSKTLYFGELLQFLRRSSPAKLLGMDSLANGLPQGLGLVDERLLNGGEPEMAATIERRERKKKEKEEEKGKKEKKSDGERRFTCMA